MRAALTALAPTPVIAPLPVVASETETDSPPHRAASHYLWAMLLARIYETLPLACPVCQSPMRIIAFITEAGTVQKILDHLGESSQPLRSMRKMTPNGRCRRSLCPCLNTISASPGDNNFAHPGWACALGLACACFWRWPDQFLPWE